MKKAKREEVFPNHIGVFRYADRWIITMKNKLQSTIKSYITITIGTTMYDAGNLFFQISQ